MKILWEQKKSNKIEQRDIQLIIEWAYVIKKMLAMFQKEYTPPVPSNTHNAPWLSSSLNSL